MEILKNHRKPLIHGWKMFVIFEDKEQNALELVDQFKSNLFSHEVYCFTPKGSFDGLSAEQRPWTLPTKFIAISVTNVLPQKPIKNWCHLVMSLKQGDQIEILTSRKQKPKEDWLSIAQTSKAISAIKRALKHERRALASEGKPFLNEKQNDRIFLIHRKTLTRFLKS